MRSTTSLSLFFRASGAALLFLGGHAAQAYTPPDGAGPTPLPPPAAQPARVLVSTDRAEPPALAAAGGPAGATAACAQTEWQQGRPYRSGQVVTYSGRTYIAKEDNPGYDPTISTWFWAPHAC